MSNEVEILGSVIEFSIGLAGFSGVVAAFTNRSHWGPIERYRLVNLLVASLIPGFSCFFALGALELKTSVQNPWGVSSAFLLLCICALIFRVHSGRNAMPSKDREQVNMGLFFTLNGLLLLTCASLILNMTGYWGSNSFFWFYLGLITLLFVGVVLFGIAVLSGSPGQVTENAARDT